MSEETLTLKKRAEDEREDVELDNSAESNEERPTRKLNEDEIPAAVEALIFAASQPVPSQKISDTLGKIGVNAVKRAVAELNEKYSAGGHAFNIRQVGGGYQYYILPDKTEFVKKLFTRDRKLRLTKAALETLAVIAYKQPVSKNQLEYIRGVACDGVINNLLEKNLIRVSGRSEGVGRPLLYSATEEFLRFFGLNSFDELPQIPEIEEMIAAMEAQRAAAQDEAGPQTVEEMFAEEETDTSEANVSFDDDTDESDETDRD